MKKNHAAGRLIFTTDAADGVAHGRRPVHRRRHAARRGRLGRPASTCWRSPTTIAERMEEPKVVVDKSTVPVGTADRVKARIAEVLAAARLASLGFDVVSNPEFLKEGAAVADCMRPDRIVVGTTEPGDRGAAARGLRPVQPQPRQDHRDGPALGGAHQIRRQLHARDQDQLHERDGQPRRAARRRHRGGAPRASARDPRIGYHFIYPGAGYGGSCFPKDVKALIHTAASVEFEPQVLPRSRRATRRRRK